MQTTCTHLDTAATRRSSLTPIDLIATPRLVTRPQLLNVPVPVHRRLAQIDKREFLKPDSTIDVLFWKGKAIDVQIPSVVILQVTEAAPGAKGNTAGGRTEKPVTLETGATLMVPMFIEEGEMVRVDTDEKKYLGRSNE